MGKTSVTWASTEHDPHYATSNTEYTHLHCEHTTETQSQTPHSNHNHHP